mmetsp:Transcript_16467/g.34395  ORF Transcript_16467/g.34395 Transcript_16467/m.34395 type:complete len:215 (+) Transcript_16467:766-1410(+)
MQRHAAFRVPGSQLAGNHRTPIATLRAVVAIAQQSHQLRKMFRHENNRGPWLSGRLAPAVARDAGGHHVETLQKRQQLQEFHNGSGPAVDQQQRDSIGVRRTLVDEVGLEAIHGQSEVWKRVQLLFLLTPVKFVEPVRHIFFQCHLVRSIGPSSVGIPQARSHIVGHQPRTLQPQTEVLQHVVRHMDGEGAGSHFCHGSRRPNRKTCGLWRNLA